MKAIGREQKVSGKQSVEMGSRCDSASETTNDCFDGHFFHVDTVVNH